MVEKSYSKIKVLHIISGDLWAGAESQVYNTLCALQDNEKICVACLLFNDGILKNKLDAFMVRTYVVDESKHHSLFIYIRMYRIVKKFKPDLIHVHHTKEHLLGLLCALSRKGIISLIRTMHGLHGVRPGLPLYKRLRSFVVVSLDGILLKYFSNAVIAVSRDLRRLLDQKKLKAKIYLIYNSLNIDTYILHDKKEQDKALERYRPDNVFWVGTAARLVRPKNLGMLIDVGAILKKEGIPFQISIFGEGPLENKLKAHISYNNIEKEIKLHGFEDKILDIITALDVFVLCSRHEGLPMALIEAMFVETPVVCTNVGGMTEVVENEINGLVVESNDVVSLANALMRLHSSTDLQNRIKANAKQTVVKHFLTKHTIKKLISVYEEQRK